LKEAGSFRDEPIRFITRSGVVKDALWSAEKINLGGTEVMLSLIYDFSARKRAEDALRAKTEELDRFFSVALDLLCIADTDGRFLRLNPQWQAVLGYPISDLEGRRFLDLVHPDDLEATMESLSRLRAQEAVLDFTNRYRCSDGSYRWIEWRSFPAGALVYAAARDITDRKRTEQALRESEEVMRYIIKHDPNALAVFDHDMKYIAVSDRFLEDYNVKEANLPGRSHYEVFPELPDTWKDIHHRVLQGAIERNDDDRFKRPDGSVTYNRWECRPWYRADGAIGGLIMYTEVTTERKLAELALRGSLLEKESLLKEVHHRVKNNLQVISSLLQLQARKVRNPELHGFLRDTQNRVRSMALLHETLYRSDNLAKVSLPQYIKTVCTHVARSYTPEAGHIRLRHEIADVNLELDQAIPVGLIISELVSNAFKHAFPLQVKGEILVELQTEGEHDLLLRVSDNGVGLPSDTDPASADTLGLLLVRNLTRQLGGRLLVKRSEGTVFELMFPGQSI
jgi:PAS domain S-box-containing protein